MRQLQNLFRNRALFLIWLIFVCKGLFYCAIFPVWEGFDEYAHFAFIQHLDTYKSLPLPETRVSKEIEQSLANVPLPWSLKKWEPPHVTHDAYWQLPAEERARREQEFQSIPIGGLSEQRENFLYEGTQGPLYYLLMAPLYHVVRDFELPTRVFLFRLLNILIGSAIIPIAFVTARKVFPDPRLAVGVCAVIAAMPGIYIDGSRVGNQTLAMVEYGLLTWFCLIALRDNRKYFLPAGLILGMLLVTKAYGLAAIPAVGVVGLEIVWKTPSKRIQNTFLVIASFCLAAGISGWWFLRNLRLAGAIIWVGGAPSEDLSYLEIIRRTSEVHWSQLVRSLLDSHTWVGNWSFLSLRSWMYHTFNYWVLLIIAGIVILVVRQFRRVELKNSISLPSLLILVLLWGGFLLSLLYHGMVNFLNEGVGASAGWYIYAVIVPEGILIIAGLSAFRFSRGLILGLVACSILLEVYASHWILIPYYVGLIRHTVSGALQSFHPEKMGIGIFQLLTRLTVNRPPFLTGTVLVGIWVAYLSATIGLFFVALKNLREPHPYRPSGGKGEPG